MRRRKEKNLHDDKPGENMLSITCFYLTLSLFSLFPFPIQNVCDVHEKKCNWWLFPCFCCVDIEPIFFCFNTHSTIACIRVVLYYGHFSKVTEMSPIFWHVESGNNLSRNRVLLFSFFIVRDAADDDDAKWSSSHRNKSTHRIHLASWRKREKNIMKIMCFCWSWCCSFWEWLI